MRGAQANGEQIQAVRLARGLTQEQLASVAAVDVRTIRKAERGQRVDLGTMTRISFSLDIDVGSLIVRTRSPEELEIRRRDAMRRWHDGWEAHDIQTLLNLYHDDAVVHLPGAPDIPFAGTHRGKEAIRRAHETAWRTCKTEPMFQGDFSLLMSDNTAVLSGTKEACLLENRSVKLSCVQIFTFLPNSELVADQRVEFDTLNFARLFRLVPLSEAAPSKALRPSQDEKSFR
jgi:transcriptional regulator with XRE-family HTH domain